MLENYKKAIMDVLQTPMPNNKFGVPYGRGPQAWKSIRDGDLGTPPLDMKDKEASQAINALIKEGLVEVAVRGDHVYLRLTWKASQPRNLCTG